VTGVELAAAADRAAERDHRKRPKPTRLAQAEQLRDVVGVAVAAVGPDLDAVAQAGLHQREVDGARPDVDGSPRGAGHASAQRRCRLEAESVITSARPLRCLRRSSDVRHHRTFTDTRSRGCGLQLGDQLARSSIE